MTVLAYANSFAGVFLFDDIIRIVEEPRIQRLWPVWPLLAGERPVVDLTLAINYAISELKPWSYHALNLVIHILAGVTLYGVVWRTILRAGTKARRHEGAELSQPGGEQTSIPDDRARCIAFCVALLFLLHPLQTQSVTYVIQRGESMMGFFYLLTLYCAIRAVDSARARGWGLAAIVACALGMGTKAVMVTAPALIVLWDWVFIHGENRKTPFEIRRRAPLYAGLLATWVVLWFCGIGPEVLNPNASDSHVGFSYRGHSAWEYAATQPGVIVKYLQLAFWPASLCLDYDWPIARSWRQIVVPSMFVGVLVAASAYLLYRRHWLGFAGAWFFVILSPTSSIVPIKDVMFEHRMYLPLAAVIAAVAAPIAAWMLKKNATVHAGDQRRKIRFVAGAALMVVVAAPLAYATHVRNRVYHSELAMWQDVVAKRPDNARGYLGIGVEMLKSRDIDAAITHLRRAIAIKHGYSGAHFNLGIALDAAGQYIEAANEYLLAVQQDPARLNLVGLAAQSLGKAAQHDEAVRLLRMALEKDPVNADFHYQLANALADMGKLPEARQEFEKAIRLNPGHSDARINFGNLHLRENRPNEAMAQYKFVLAHEPQNSLAGVNLGRALLHLEQWEAALRAFERVPPGDPLLAEAKFGIGWALVQLKRIDEAKSAFREALKIDPNHAGAAAELARLKDKGPKTP